VVSAAHLDLSVERLTHGLAYRRRVGPQLAQNRAGDAVGLVEQRGEHVLRSQLLVTPALCQSMGGLHRFLSLDG
jgi:hypothetical protein